MVAARDRERSERRLLAWHAANIINLTGWRKKQVTVDELLNVPGESSKPLSWDKIVDIFGPVAKDERDGIRDAVEAGAE